MAGGGVLGKAADIAHCFIPGDGFIIKISPVSILTWTQAGEQVTWGGIGTGIAGTMNVFLTNDFNRIGKTGERITIGKDRSIAEYITIDPDRNNRDRI
jgi:hypothetical protein